MSRFSYELIHNSSKYIDTRCDEEKEELKYLEEILRNIEDFRNISPGFYPLTDWKDHGKDEYGGTLFVLHLENVFGEELRVRAPSSLAEEVKHNKPRFVWKHGLCKDREKPVHGFSIVC